MSAELTLEEQERILEETYHLIKEPPSWTTGRWKCNLYEADKDGNFVPEEGGGWKRARDMNNRPLSQYCIEGGLNQATYNVVGRDRAIKLGAVQSGFDPESEDDAFVSDELRPDPADHLGINKLAFEMHRKHILDAIRENGEEPDDYDGDNAAMILNDSFNAPGADKVKGHKTMLELVQTRLDQVRDELDAREGAHAEKELVGSV